MPPKDYVPPIVCIRLSDGTIQEAKNTYTIGEINAWCESHEYVKVIRCNDCKYYKIAQLKKDYTPDERFKPSICTKGQFAVRRDPDWYCADGEPKEET